MVRLSAGGVNAFGTRKKEFWVPQPRRSSSQARFTREQAIRWQELINYRRAKKRKLVTALKKWALKVRAAKFAVHSNWRQYRGGRRHALMA
jgi:hypothetical protein